MNWDHALGAEFRAVKDLTHQGQPVRGVEGSRIYATNPQDLWEAITEPDRLARWFAPVTGDLRLDGTYAIEGNASGSIKQCDPPSSLELTWEFGPSVSWLRVELTEEASGTRLTLLHLLPKDAGHEGHWKTYGPGATGVGWDLAFLGLGLYVESEDGEIDREASEAWLGTDDGKKFLSACASGWGQAHEAAGEAESVAQEMAQRTASFYRGE